MFYKTTNFTNYTNFSCPMRRLRHAVWGRPIGLKIIKKLNKKIIKRYVQ